MESTSNCITLGARDLGLVRVIRQLMNLTVHSTSSDIERFGRFQEQPLKLPHLSTDGCCTSGILVQEIARQRP